jgi:hypothetical protein
MLKKLDIIRSKAERECFTKKDILYIGITQLRSDFV